MQAQHTGAGTAQGAGARQPYAGRCCAYLWWLSIKYHKTHAREQGQGSQGVASVVHTYAGTAHRCRHN